MVISATAAVGLSLTSLAAVVGVGATASLMPDVATAGFAHIAHTTPLGAPGFEALRTDGIRTDTLQASARHAHVPAIAGVTTDLFQVTVEDPLEAFGLPAAPKPVTLVDPLAGLTDADVPEDGKLGPWLLEHKDPFLALATTIESIQPHPYWDGGGLNVGMGYCITQRRIERGDEVVKKDLEAAGLDNATVTLLMGHDRHAQKSVTLTRPEALRLLERVRGEYQDIARTNLGADTFDALPENRKAALTWLAYNTGPKGFPQFHRLMSAVKNGQHAEALNHITPWYSDGGQLVPNTRAGSLLMGAYGSEKGLRHTVENPADIEDAARTGVSPVDRADPDWNPKARHPKAGKAGTHAAPASPGTNAPAHHAKMGLAMLDLTEGLQTRLDQRRTLSGAPAVPNPPRLGSPV
jgi:GH24 family phage-related lysozyme (muramidase)